MIPFQLSPVETWKSVRKAIPKFSKVAWRLMPSQGFSSLHTEKGDLLLCKGSISSSPHVLGTHNKTPCDHSTLRLLALHPEVCTQWLQSIVSWVHDSNDQWLDIVQQYQDNHPNPRVSNSIIHFLGMSPTMLCSPKHSSPLPQGC